MTQEKYYSRQTSLPEVGREGQDKLLKAKCLVVGAGGLGSSALYYLAAAGVGNLGVCDGDRVDITNLHRQILYTVDDIGQHKAQAAAKRLKELNPYIHLQPYCDRLTSASYISLLSGYDLVLDCTDNFDTKFLLNDACYFLKIPLIRSSIYRFEGQLQFYLPNDACLRCLWPQKPEEGCVGSCAEVGVIGPLPGFFGTLQAMEAIKFFLGLPSLQSNVLLMYDLIAHTQRIIYLEKCDACPLCGKNPSIIRLGAPSAIEIEPSAFDSEMFQLVDIRELEEVHNNPLQRYSFLHYPMSSFDSELLEERKNYLLFCQSGKRSTTLATHLRALGKSNVYSLRGGIQTLNR